MATYSPIELAWMVADYSKKEKKIRDGVVFDGYGVTIKWRFDYEIEWSRLETPLDLLSWCQHLSRKNWADKMHIGIFVEEVCKYKGWRLTV